MTKDIYSIDPKQGELTQQVWETVEEHLDTSKLKKCSCCNESLIKDFFETEEDFMCRMCKNKARGFQGVLNIDYSILQLYSLEELEELRVEYKEYIDSIDTDLETYLALYNKFSNFLRYAWYHLGLPEPTEAQLQFCDFLQYTQDHTIINAFRGIGKSWITSIFVAWKLWQDNTLKILVISASKERADSFSIFTKRLFQELPILNELIPRGERTSNKAFDIGDIPPAHAPSVKSAGITGQITGSRADIIIADDVEVIDNSATEDAREKLLEKCKEFVSILTPKKTSLILYLGTPQTEESIYDKMSAVGYKKYIIPARYPSNIEKYKGFLAPYIVQALLNNPDLVGKSTDPQRFSDEELLSRELLIGTSTFNLQFQLDTELSDLDRYPLRTSNLICTELDGNRCPSYISYSSAKHSMIRDFDNIGFSGDRFYEAGYIEEPYVPYTGKLLVIDPKGTGVDETGWAVIGHFLGRLYVIDFGGLDGTGYSDDNLSILAGIAERYKVNRIAIEANFGDGMFTRMFEPYVRRLLPSCFIEDIKNTANKERRIIDSLEPIMTQHRLVFNKDSIRRELDWVKEDKLKRQKYSLIYQMTHISKERNALKHDDRLDALAIGVKVWEEYLNKDVDKASKDFKDQRILEELERLKRYHNQLYPNKTEKKRKAIDKVLKQGGRQRQQRQY